MSAPIFSAPLTIADRAQQESALAEREEIAICDLNRMEPEYSPSGLRLPPCQKMVKIGLFFDGTSNNKYRDEPNQAHTNIVKLFNAHKEDARGLGNLEQRGCYRFYIPGVGTRFPENQEWKETQEGKAMGKGGQARILFAILQVYNAVHRAFNENRALFSDAQLTAKLKSYTRDVENNYDKEYPQHERRRRWFTELRDELNDRLQAQRDIIIQPRIPKIRVAVFGFSRGAIEARSFCYWLHAALEEKSTLAGMPIEINFLGLFDSVASVGLPHSAAKTTPFRFIDGHFSWAAETLTPLPSLVKQTVHYIAAHEQRMNFPVTRVQGNNVQEVLYPGVHSDVGGGYCPKEQGRGMTVGQMVSQVPLLHMHKIARLAGVPLVTYHRMASDLQADYALSPELATNWNAYMAAGDFAGTYESQVREHMQMYYRFRYHWSGRMAQLPACQRATPQEQQDMISYEDLFKGDMELLRERAKDGRPRMYRANGDEIKFFAPEHSHIANREQLLRADIRQVPDETETLALQVFEEQRGQSKAKGIALLEEQVHDSLAGFYLGGYVSAEEKAEKLRTWQTKPPSENDRYHHQAWQNFEKAKMQNPELQKILDDKAALAKQVESARFNGRTGEMESLQRRVAFTDEESSLLTRDAHGKPIFPVQKDSDANALCSVFVTTQTETLREGGGYLSPRVVFLP
ncbi:T6SS phospholipase effector Tle1-like catalytic domain-containing protein [Herbaspirillum hiltneri]|uniref:T6SS phospholipase effector Tle1-like catalytic domain-containing protein n=1 Tax=Herbaspirillum hiltneri TaxID=341045 RepID=UPI000A7596DE|nr:DUF2235 domain-containing protein [Herbaspirillum hiltneri]